MNGWKDIRSQAKDRWLGGPGPLVSPNAPTWTGQRFSPSFLLRGIRGGAKDRTGTVHRLMRAIDAQGIRPVFTSLSLSGAE